MKIHIISDNDYSIDLGRSGENETLQNIFDLKAWKEMYGDGVPELVVQRPDGVLYPAKLVEDTFGRFAWEVTDADTEIPGTGKAQLNYYIGQKVAKSKIFDTHVLESLTGTVGPVPEPQQGWLDKIAEAGAIAEANSKKTDADRKAVEQTSRHIDSQKMAVDSSANEAEKNATLAINCYKETAVLEENVRGVGKYVKDASDRISDTENAMNALHADVVDINANVEESKTIVDTAKNETIENAKKAQWSAEAAEQVANNAGYMFFTIINGRLQMNKTANTVNFNLREGRLMLSD